MFRAKSEAKNEAKLATSSGCPMYFKREFSLKKVANPLKASLSSPIDLNSARFSKMEKIDLNWSNTDESSFLQDPDW